MISRGEYKKQILAKLKDIDYDEETDTIIYKDTSIPFEKVYQNFIKKNGMSFECIYDAHWECMSILQCTECGTVVKCLYDEYYEPNFKCPTCTDYKTGYEYYTKDQIENSEDLKAIIKMYKELDQMDQERYERKEKRKGLEDYQLCNAKRLKIKDNVYELNFLIDSIVNKNKLKGLRLEITKWKMEDDINMSLVYHKIIPLSKSAYISLNQMFSSNNFPNEIKGKPLTQIMEESAVKRLKRRRY